MLSNLKLFLKDIYAKTRKALLRPLLLLRKTTLPSKHAIKSILFLRHDRIGDMVLSTAAIKALEIVYPEAKVSVLASERNHALLQYNPHVDEVLIYKGFNWFIKTVRPRRFDLVIDPFLTYEMKQAFMTYLANGTYRIGFEDGGREIFFNVKGPHLLLDKPFVDHMLALIGHLNGDIVGCRPELFITDEEIQWASRFLLNKGIDTRRLTIAIHPGGYYETQRWPSERFGAVAKRIVKELKANVIIFGVPDEKIILGRIEQISRDDVFIISNLSIRQLMAILVRCNLFLGNNSGPLHIAAALGLPTVSTMGPTVTPLWLPYGKNHIILRKELRCSPCNKAKCEDHSCMRLITEEEVMDVVKSQIDRIKTAQITKGES